MSSSVRTVVAGAVAALARAMRMGSRASNRKSGDLNEPMAAARRRLAEGLATALSRTGLSERDWGTLEEELIAADLGVEASERIVQAVRRSRPAGPEEAREVIRAEMIGILSGVDRRLRLHGDPSIVVVVGVNGAGKTTTVAKLASHLLEMDRRPIIGAADTFRPAADTQLMIWAERAGVQVVSGRQGADPASVAYDALQAGRARGADTVIVDTAGRFETRRNLMGELAKIIRVLGRDGDRVSETLLVMDATTGQSGLSQARGFAGVGVTGVVLTKMDGDRQGWGGAGGGAGTFPAGEVHRGGRDPGRSGSLRRARLRRCAAGGLMNPDQLAEEARRAAQDSYSPYSGFRVGAVVVGAAGERRAGSNVENAAYGSSICAEATAISGAVAGGLRKIVGVAVACIDAADLEGAYPCGNCRQLMAEFGVEWVVVTAGPGSEVRRHPFKELHPFAFHLEEP